jgi:hypothetical protein
MAVPPNESSATLNVAPSTRAARAVVAAPELPAHFQEELNHFIRAAGFDAFTVAHDVRTYGDEDGSWTSNVFTITVKGAADHELSRFTLDLIDYLDDHEDERVRKGVTVRVQ